MLVRSNTSKVNYIFLTAEFLWCCRSDLTRCCWKRRKNQRLAWRSWIYCRHVPGFIYIFIPYSEWQQKILTIHVATNCYTESSNGFSLGMEFSNIIFLQISVGTHLWTRTFQNLISLLLNRRKANKGVHGSTRKQMETSIKWL